MTITSTDLGLKERKVISENLHLRAEIDLVRDNALEKVKQEKSSQLREENIDDLLSQYHSYQTFKYMIAEGIATILARYDKNINTVYIFDPSINPDAGLWELLPLDLVIHLLVQVKMASAGLTSLTLSLDRCLTQSLKELPTSLFEKCDSALDLIQITRESVEQRTGYGALLTSLHAPPLKVFQR